MWGLSSQWKLLLRLCLYILAPVNPLKLPHCFRGGRSAERGHQIVWLVLPLSFPLGHGWLWFLHKDEGSPAFNEEGPLRFLVPVWTLPWLPGVSCWLGSSLPEHLRCDSWVHVEDGVLPTCRVGHIPDLHPKASEEMPTDYPAGNLGAAGQSIRGKAVNSDLASNHTWPLTS